MKTPTTPFAIAMMERPDAITRQFLLSQGWELIDEKPIFETFQHTSNTRCLKCSIGMYGEFSITELHWCNETPERVFSTYNNKLTTQDYFTIISLLNIGILTAPATDTGKK